VRTPRLVVDHLHCRSRTTSRWPGHLRTCEYEHMFVLWNGGMRSSRCGDPSPCFVQALQLSAKRRRRNLFGNYKALSKRSGVCGRDSKICSMAQTAQGETAHDALTGVPQRACASLRRTNQSARSRHTLAPGPIA
jgi:hypothetical protein